MTLTAFGLSGALTAISALLFGWFVYVKSAERDQARAWLLFSLSVCVWGIGAFTIGSVVTTSASGSLLAWKLAYGLGVLWIPSLFYHFVALFLRIHRPKTIRLNYAASLFWLFFLPTSLLFREVRFYFDSFYYAIGGAVNPIYFVWWTGLVIYSHVELLRAYPKVAPAKQAQIRWFGIATTIGYFGGITTYLGNFEIEVYPWGNFGVILYPFIMSYAILKHQLLDVRVILRKTLVYSALSALLIGIYVGAILVFSQILGQLRPTSSAIPSAAAAAIIAILFHPLRIKIQHVIDSLFPTEALDPRLLREITGGFVHEIKRPLSHIALPAELALGAIDDLRAQRGDANALMDKAQSHLRHILRQSLDAGARMEALRELMSPQHTRVNSFDVAELVRQSIESEQAALTEAGVDVHFDAATPLYAQGAPHQVAIVITNLIRNAVDAMKPCPVRRLTITAVPDADRITLRFEDTGPGVPAALQKTIFQPYFTTKQATGMGLGLFLCHRLLEAQGGSIRLLPTTPGATFVIELRKA
jgi:signal transduction histidine kinase